MILYNTAFNFQAIESLQDATYLGLHLFEGTPPNRQQILDAVGVDSKGRVNPYDIHLHYDTLAYIYGSRTNVLSSPEYYQENIAKLKFSVFKQIPTQFVYRRDGTATWFMYAWTGSSYPSNSKATATEFVILGSVSDLDGNGDLKMSQPVIAADSSMNPSDIIMNHDPFEHMV